MDNKYVIFPDLAVWVIVFATHSIDLIIIVGTIGTFFPTMIGFH